MLARRTLLLSLVVLALGILVLLPRSTYAANGSPVHALQATLNHPPKDDGDVPPKGARKPVVGDEEGEDFILARNEDFVSKRLAGDQPLSLEEASAARLEAATQTISMKANGLARLPQAYGGTWNAVGPNPIAQITRGSQSFYAVSGRIGALTILPNGRRILGAAQGGIWVWDSANNVWSPRTDNIPSLAIGALAYAPSNPNIVYAGTGEGALSGDSYAGNGVLKSPDGGTSWFLVSGHSFRGVAISFLAVDPTNADHLYAAVLRGRGGSRRVTYPPNTQYGIYESKDGGASWTLRKGTTDQFKGATDLKMDPQNPNILYASFWGTGIFRSADGGQTWKKIMNGFPTDAVYDVAPTRFALGLSHPAAGSPVLYAGFEYDDTNGDHHPSRVWKSTDEGQNWTLLPVGTYPDSVDDYCGSQCFYDNVIDVDPNNPDIVYVLGLFDYGNGAGGVFRSEDGGTTWRNLGWDLHPDYHAIAINPGNTQEVIIGNDGGVWVSADRGGRPNAADPLSAVTWQNLNGSIDPNTGAVTARTGLQIAQFTSMATNPTTPIRLWGGTQDNGTLRRSSVSQTWSDLPSGDGGQAITDPTDGNYLYGTYFGITPYRFVAPFFFFGNFYIRNGLDLGDRSEFYIPFVMNKSNPNQLFLGTFRLYRTDNAKAADASDVLWTPITGDLTSGCTGTAPNGARGCFISAIAVSGGGGGVWVGTDDGYVQFSASGTFAAHPKFKRVGAGVLPNRPVSSIAVDQSNNLVAYVAYGGYKQTTPTAQGHVYATINGGKTWKDITGNLPNIPVNSIVRDPSFPDTLYAGTDTGPFVTNNGGQSWAPLGSGFPIVGVWQLDVDPTNRTLAAGTHGRGAFRLDDAANAVPALVMSKSYPNTPVGPDTDMSFSITVKNIGNAAATGVTITDQIPSNTKFVSADNGGTKVKDRIVWSGLSIPAGGSLTVSAVLHVKPDATGKVTNKIYTVKSAEGVGARGSARNLRLARRHETMVSPQSQLDGTRRNQSVDYIFTVKNLGFATDTFNLSVSGNTFATEIRDATCTNVITQTGALAAGATQDICVHVTVSNSANNGDTDNTTLTVQSASASKVKDTASVQTIAVTDNILLVDEDGNAPDVNSYYTTALDAYGQPYNVWDLDARDGYLPLNYLKAHKNVVWFTGNSYPAPITPYETELAALLDGGGRLFMSGQDILDQAAGTTTFVSTHLHINWDGSETQNDKSTANVTGVGGNPVTNGIGTIGIDHSVLGAAFEDRITPIAPATNAFTDDTNAPDGLTVDTGTYRVLFIAFPFEAYGSAGDKATLMADALNWFTGPLHKANPGGKGNGGGKGTKGGTGK